jgi:DNA-binding response OmpR family regulator
LRRYIWFLRKKIEEDPESPRRLVTVRGYGYRLEA